MGKTATYPAVRINKLAPEYTKGEEIFNAVSHIVGGALGLAALVTLLIYAYPNAGYMASVAAFGVSVIVLYTMSALYHFLPRGGGKKVFRIFDHCTIFLLIAGTYTPFCVIALGLSTTGIVILVIEWGLAVLGITGNAIAMNNKVIKGISMAFYCVMGWLILIAFGELFQNLTLAEFVLLLAGGLAYTLGIIFYALGKKNKVFSFGMAPFRRRGYRFAICKPSVIVALIQKSFVSFVKGIQYLVLDNFSIIQHLVFKLLTNAIGIAII